MVRALLRAVSELPGWQKAAIVAVAAAIVLTWVAVCVILVSYL